MPTTYHLCNLPWKRQCFFQILIRYPLSPSLALGSHHFPLSNFQGPHLGVQSFLSLEIQVAFGGSILPVPRFRWKKYYCQINPGPRTWTGRLCHGISHTTLTPVSDNSKTSSPEETLVAREACFERNTLYSMVGCRNLYTISNISLWHHLREASLETDKMIILSFGDSNSCEIEPSLRNMETLYCAALAIMTLSTPHASLNLAMSAYLSISLEPPFAITGILTAAATRFTTSERKKVWLQLRNKSGSKI